MPDGVARGTYGGKYHSPACFLEQLSLLSLGRLVEHIKLHDETLCLILDFFSKKRKREGNKTIIIVFFKRCNYQKQVYEGPFSFFITCSIYNFILKI